MDLGYTFRHPLDVTVSTTQCILELTGRLCFTIFEILLYIASKFGVSKSVMIIDSCGV